VTSPVTSPVLLIPGASSVILSVLNRLYKPKRSAVEHGSPPVPPLFESRHPIYESRHEIFVPRQPQVVDSGVVCKCIIVLIIHVNSYSVTFRFMHYCNYYLSLFLHPRFFENQIIHDEKRELHCVFHCRHYISHMAALIVNFPGIQTHQ
jgi:hypothetical protein